MVVWVSTVSCLPLIAHDGLAWHHRPQLTTLCCYPLIESSFARSQVNKLFPSCKFTRAALHSDKPTTPSLTHSPPPYTHTLTHPLQASQCKAHMLMLAHLERLGDEVHPVLQPDLK